MFRVLSEEEARNVTRWKAPDLSGSSETVAKTRQYASPIKTKLDDSIRSLKSDVPATTTHPEAQISAPELQASQSTTTIETIATTANIPLPTPSVDMLQASYDDGYSRGFAEGNAALHQQSVKQLNTIIEAMDRGTSKPYDAALEQDVLALSVDIARLLMRREILERPDGIHQLVQAGLEQLPGLASAPSRVYLHPLDANLVRDVMTDTPNVQIMDDVQLDRGECTIESGSSTVHSGIDNWLDIMAVELGVLPMSERATHE